MECDLCGDELGDGETVVMEDGEAVCVDCQELGEVDDQDDEHDDDERYDW